MANNHNMKISKQNFISVFDTIFITTLLTLFTFVWLKYFIKNNILSFVISFIISLILVFIFTLRKKSKLEKKITKIETDKRIDSFIYSFFLLGKDETSKLIYNNIKKIKPATLNENIIICEDENIFSFLHKEELTLNDISHIYQKAKKLNIDTITLLTINSSKTVSDFSKSINDVNIKILSKKQTFYSYIQRYAIYPKILVAQKTSKKESFFKLIKLSFNRERTKHFVFSGIIMLIFSLFFKYNLYYVIVSSLLFIFAIISYFLKNKNELY